MTSDKHTKTKIESYSEISWVRWLELSAGLAGAIGIAGLVALLSQSAFAIDNKGLNPGSKPFGSNPFGNPPSAGATPPAGQPPQGGAQNFYPPEDDFEEEDYPDYGGPTGGYAPPQGSAGSGGGNYGGGISAGGQPSSEGTAPTYSNKGVAVGGSNPGGVITHNNSRTEPVNSETGEGSKETVTDFNFPDADILDIAKTLGKLTGKNFIYDKDVKGRISILSNGPITVGDAWKAFLTALDMNGFAIIPSGKYIRIARQRDARDKQLKTYTGDYSPDTDALITRVFPLKYIDAEEVARTFRSFMPANSRIIPYGQTNTVIVTDTGSNIAKLNKMLELLDIEGYDAGIEVIPVKWASAAELSKLVDQLLPSTGSAPGAPPGAPRFGGAGGRFNARRTKEGGIVNNIIADERTNNLIVHANTKGADQVRELIAKLDKKQAATTGGGKIHVVYLQFAEAEAIATTLNNLSQAAPGGFKPTTPGGTGGTGVNPVSATLFEGSIKVSPDKSTNSLVITASPNDFVTVQRVINRLDIQRDQVYVEAIVMEVTIDRQATWSANVAAPGVPAASVVSQDLAQFITSPLQQTGALLGFKAGGTSTVTIAGQSVQVSGIQGLIKAIQTYAGANVLATPQIIALDNSEATFESTDKIPIPVSTAVQGAGVQQSFQKENITLSIKIKPQINKLSNFVKLETEVKIGDITNKSVAEVGGIRVPSTLDRTAKATVVVGDSDTVVIGGLIRDRTLETVSKIPILGDIPILGWFFKAKTTESQKTNLLVFLTPHIVRPYEKVRAILDKKLKDRDTFLEKNAGGEDPLRYQRDDMIRNLPDLSELNERKPQTSVSIDEETPQEPAAVEVPAVPEEGQKSEAPVTGSEAIPPTAPPAPLPAPGSGG